MKTSPAPVPTSKTTSVALDVGPAKSVPATCSVEAAAALLGISKATAYRAIRERMEGDVDAWPTPIITIRRRIRIPAQALFAVLGVEPTA